MGKIIQVTINLYPFSSNGAYYTYDEGSFPLG